MMAARVSLSSLESSANIDHEPNGKPMVSARQATGDASVVDDANMARNTQSQYVLMHSSSLDSLASARSAIAVALAKFWRRWDSSSSTSRGRTVFPPKYFSAAES